MAAIGEAEARRVLRTLGLFAEDAIAAATLERQFGLTNAVYRVGIGAESFSLRLPGAGTARIIDRRREEANARAAAHCGVAPEVLHFSADGIMLSRFVEGGPLSPQRFRDDPATIDRAARALRDLHSCPENFSGVFDAFERIAFYEKMLRDAGTRPSMQQQATIRRVEAIREALYGVPAPLRACHCDPTGRNLIDTGDRVWLIDWEYSGLNDPTWDLAYLSIEADFNAQQEDAMNIAYFGGRPSSRDAARVAAFKPLCQVLSALWAFVQYGTGNSSANFLAYGEHTLASASARMDDPAFERQLAVLRG